MNSRAVALLGLLQTGFFLGGWMFVSLIARSQMNNGTSDSSAIHFRHHYWWLLLFPPVWTLLAAWWSANREPEWLEKFVIILSSPGIGILFVWKCILVMNQAYR